MTLAPHEKMRSGNICMSAVLARYVIHFHGMPINNSALLSLLHI